jgi:hypothetical protein
MSTVKSGKLSEKRSELHKKQKGSWDARLRENPIKRQPSRLEAQEKLFKNGRTKCRYGIPSKPCICTEATAVFTQPPPRIHAANPLNEETPHPKPQIKELHIDVKKRTPFQFFTDSNSSIMSVINCNNCTK